MLGVRASLYKLGEGDAIQFIAEGKKPNLTAPLFRPLLCQVSEFCSHVNFNSSF